ncbi:hypothetical protein [Micromonospora sp. NPDC005299]|uniref:hypothetical protein n=1 Tax=Micromonospora sp. NPDC005299 TaxID=3364231 RepID=UPI0036AFF877
MPSLAVISAADTRWELSAKYTYCETITDGTYLRTYLRRCCSSLLYKIGKGRLPRRETAFELGGAEGI